MARTRRTLAIDARAQTGVGTAQVVADPARPTGRLLLIDGVASGYVDLRDPQVLGLDYLHRLGAALDALVPRGAASTVVHLGGGAFALPRRIAATRPHARQEVYEIDPAIAALARRHLRLRPSPALEVRIGDAAVLLAGRPDASADVVVGDAFVGTEVPDALVASGFAATVRRVLRDGGIYLLNVVDTAPPVRAREAVAGVLGAFPGAVVFGARGMVRGEGSGNLLVAAGTAGIDAAALGRRLAGGPHPSDVRPAREYLVA